MLFSNIKCSCGGNLILKRIQQTEKININNHHHTITIHDVPYYICQSNPNDVGHYKTTKKTKVKINCLIDYALNNKLNEVSYNTKL